MDNTIFRLQALSMMLLGILPLYGMQPSLFTELLASSMYLNHFLASVKAPVLSQKEGTVILESADNKKVTLARRIAELSQTVAHMLSDMTLDANQPISLPQVSGRRGTDRRR